MPRPKLKRTDFSDLTEESLRFASNRGSYIRVIRADRARDFLVRLEHSNLPLELKLLSAILLTTGCRLNEALRLTFGDFDPIKGQVTIRVSKARREKWRQCEIHPLVLGLLKVMGLGEHPKAQKVFTRFSDYRHALKAYTGLNSHAFRHSFISFLVKANINPVTITRKLGISNIQTVMHYSHLDNSVFQGLWK